MALGALFAMVGRARGAGAAWVAGVLLAVGLLGPPSALGYTVTTNGDTGAGSLRDGILNSTDTTITVNAGIGDILVGSPLVIDRDVTISGAADTVVKGGNAHRVFHVKASRTVTLSGMTIRDGLSENEAATPCSDAGGAGLCIEAGATVTLSGVTMVHNISTASGVGIGTLGGGVLDLGALHVANSTFTDNHATATTPGTSADGGAIALSGAGSLTATGGSFTSNAATAAPATGSATAGSAHGGAIDDQGSGALTVTGTSFATNSATAGNAPANPGEAHGGAVANQAGATVTLTGASLSGNTVLGGTSTGSSGGGNTGRGGAVDDSGAGPVNITGSTLTGNTATGGESPGSSALGGGSGRGGGVNDDGGGNMSVDTSSITQNTAVGGDAHGSAAASGTGRGAGVNNIGSGTVTVTRTLIAGNNATGGGTDASARGGGVDNSAGGTVALTNTTVTGNHANGHGPSAAGRGGGTLSEGSGGRIDMNYVTVAANQASELAGNVATDTGATTTLHSTIVAAGAAPANPNCATFGTLTSLGHNIDSADECHLGASEMRNTDPLLGPLQNNGGTTSTLALLAGSPAVNNGDAVGCPTADQPGASRPQGDACDIGAFESVAAPPTATTGDADGVFPGVATLHGSADPNAVSTTAHFEWGTSTAYGQSTPDQSIGSGTGERSVAASISGVPEGSVIHYRLVAVSTRGSATGEDRTFTAASSPADTTPPVILSVSASPKTFAIDPKGERETAVSAKAKPKRGTTFKYTLSESARVVFTVELASPGRKSGTKCVRATPKNRKRKKCIRYTRAGRFALQSVQGANTHRFSARIGTKKLKPGKYRVSLVATDAANNHSTPRSLGISIVKG